MSKDSFKQKLLKIFKVNLKIKGKFKENYKIYSVKTWDSLANFNILLDIEKKFSIKFNGKEFSNLNSFKEIYKNVKKKI